MSVDGIPKPVMSIYIPLSLNFLSSFDACLPYKITYFSNKDPYPWGIYELVYHTKLHTSQTSRQMGKGNYLLVYHTKLHTSQTNRHWLPVLLELVYHTKLHTSQTIHYDNGKWWQLVCHKKLHTSQAIFL